MATFKIYDRIAFDLDKFDLSELADGESYLATSDTFRVAYGGGAGDEFTGSGFRYDSDGFPTGGEVFTYTQIDNGFILEATGLSISARELGEAARTSSTADDRAIFVDALSGRDRFEGGAKGDVIESYRGDDTLFGGGGNDTLNGGVGNDQLAGGLGKDRLIGGLGSDDFVFDTVIGKKVIDVIDDFAPKFDQILLDSDIFGEAGALGVLKKSAFHIGVRAQDDDDRIIYDKAAGKLMYDPDGDGRAKAAVFATVDDGLKITFKDFEII